MLALVLVLIAIPLQLLGYASTCTMGDDKPFVSAALVSALPLIWAIYLMARHRMQGATASMLRLLSAASSVVLLGLTSGIWLNVIRFRTPCGFEYQFYDAAFDITDALILFSYLFLPALMAAMANPWSIRSRRTNAERHIP
jgi:hypothetical protein